MFLNGELNITDLSNITLDLINSIDLNILKCLKQDFDISSEVRYKYGEIRTSFLLIDKMLNLLDENDFKNPNNKWLDIGAGNGYFSIILYKRLYDGLKDIFPNSLIRSRYIISNMLYMSEIRDVNCDALRRIFGDDCNIISGDFLSAFININFDFVIGNPPYNSNGIKRVPSNKIKKNNSNVNTIWVSFIKKSISLLKSNGKMVVIIPSIWLKPDKAKMYNYMMSYKIESLYCMSNSETNKIFNGYAQTPTCYFCLTKEKSPGFVELMDKRIINGILTVIPVFWNIYNKYTNMPLPVPVFGSFILKKVLSRLTDVNVLNVLKTNMPLKGSKFSNILSDDFKYPNVKTCVTIYDNMQCISVPKLVIEYSDLPQLFYGESKLIMAHKMYGFPYIDFSGIYGISSRDNYVILNKSHKELNRLKDFFSTKTALYLFESTRYRMKYLERYIFDLIPDITKLYDFPEIINDISIAKYFGFDDDDVLLINDLHKRVYGRF